MIRLMLLLAAILLLTLFGLGTYLYFNQQRFILPVQVNSVAAPGPELNFQFTSLMTPEGETLHGILFLPKGPATELILAFPGNSHNPIGFATFLKTEVYGNRPDVAIAAFSYRGYPNGHTPPSEGTPGQAAMYADAELIYDQLAARLQPQQVKAVGYSIGTAVATHLATVRPLEALALVAPLASVRRIAQARYPWLPVRQLLRHPFAVEDMIAGLSLPITLIYSPTDGLIPAHHVTKVLHRQNPGLSLVAVPGTNHVSLATAPELPGLLQQALQTDAAGNKSF